MINIELDRAIEFKKQTVVTTTQRTNICDTDISDCLCIYQIWACELIRMLLKQAPGVRRNERIRNRNTLSYFIVMYNSNGMSTSSWIHQPSFHDDPLSSCAGLALAGCKQQTACDRHINYYHVTQQLLFVLIDWFYLIKIIHMQINIVSMQIKNKYIYI